MPLASIPAIDAEICSGWTEQDRELYNHMDFYLAKMQVEKRKYYPIWSNIVGDIRWKPNMGSQMKGVRKEPSPHMRQFAFPAVLGTIPKKDVVQVRELTATVDVSEHRFESPIFNFLPDFRDFMTDHIQAHSTDIEEKKMRYEDIYIRGGIFHQSPNVWLPNRAGGELVAAPTGKGNAAGTDAKTTAWLQAQLPNIGNPGNLSITTINQALTSLEDDLRVMPFGGNGGQPGDNGPLSSKYLLILSGEAFNQFIYDEWLLANKNCNLDVINQGFRANLFGRVVCRIEDYPIRLLADGTFPNPEVMELNVDAYNFGESLVNPTYRDAPYEVAFLCGDAKQAYKSLKVGPPPREFASNGMPNGFGKMFWNGEIILTKNLIVPCVDEDGNTQYEPNNYGDYLKFLSRITLGLLAQQRRWILPIIFKRVRGPAAV